MIQYKTTLIVEGQGHKVESKMYGATVIG